jgi:hypothetical protein
MKTVYLQTTWSVNTNRGLYGAELAKHLKDEATDGFLLAHAIWPDEKAEDIFPEIERDVILESDIRQFQPDLVFLEGGLANYGEAPKISLQFAKELAERGTTIIVADVDRNAAQANAETYKSAVSLLGCIPAFAPDGRSPRYGHDPVSFHSSPSSIVCHPERMSFEEQFRPIYDGVEVLLVSSPIVLDSVAALMLATGNRDTSRVLEQDVFVDELPPFCWGYCNTVGDGFVVTLGGNISHNEVTRNFPDNARWISKMANHLYDSTLRYRELVSGITPTANKDTFRPLNELLEILGRGEEGRTVEAKETARVNVHSNAVDKEMETAALKAIAGFANTRGGTLIIGVEDGTAQVSGLARDYSTLGSRGDWDGFLNWITGTVSHRLDPLTAERINIQRETLDSDDIAVIHVPPAKDEVWLDDEEFWVRMQNSTRQLKGSRLTKYSRERF